MQSFSIRSFSSLFRLLFVGAWICSTTVSANRFLREGFSSQMEADFRAEAALEDGDASLAGMTREMYLMQELEWEIKCNNHHHIQWPGCDREDPGLRRHVEKYIRQPIHLKLLKRPGKHGLKAIGMTPDGKRLRAFWRQANTNNGGAGRFKASELLEKSYDEAIQNRLCTVEFEIVLPPYGHPNKKKKQQQPSSPSVVFQLPVESGGMNPKAIAPRASSSSIIQVYPTSRHSKGGAAVKPAVVSNAVATVGLRRKAGIVDPNWSRGRTNLRIGKSAGFI